MKIQKHTMSAVDQTISINLGFGIHQKFKHVNQNNLITFIKYLQTREFLDEPTLFYDSSLSLEQNLKNLLVLGDNTNLNKHNDYNWNYKVFQSWYDFINGKYTIKNKYELHDFCFKLLKNNKEYAWVIYNNEPYFVSIGETTFDIIEYRNDECVGKIIIGDKLASYFYPKNN